MAKKGLIYALLSALLLSTMNLFVKMLGSNIPSGEIAFFRGLFGTVAVLIVMYIKDIRFSTEDRGLLVMRGLYGGFGMVCNFIALVHMKMSDATILFQTSGIFVFIFSAFFLKERVPKGAGKWLILIFIAVMVMVNPFSYGGFTWYALVAVLGAALSAAAYTTIRSISKHGKHSDYRYDCRSCDDRWICNARRSRMAHYYCYWRYNRSGSILLDGCFCYNKCCCSSILAICRRLY